MRSRLTTRGFTIVEVAVATAIFAVLMAVSMAILDGQSKLGREQQAKAFGSAQAQSAFNQVATTLKACVYEPGAGSDFCTVSTDRFGLVKLYRIRTSRDTPPGPYTTAAPFQLAIEYPDPYLLVGVVDKTGSFLPKGNAGNGRLVVVTKTAGLADKVRVICENVTRFWVSVNRVGLLDVSLDLTTKTGVSAMGNKAWLCATCTSTGEMWTTNGDNTPMEAPALPALPTGPNPRRVTANLGVLVSQYDATLMRNP